MQGTAQDGSDTDQGSKQGSDINRECEKQDVLNENQEFEMNKMSLRKIKNM